MVQIFYITDNAVKLEGPPKRVEEHCEEIF